MEDEWLPRLKALRDVVDLGIAHHPEPVIGSHFIVTYNREKGVAGEMKLVAVSRVDRGKTTAQLVQQDPAIREVFPLTGFSFIRRYAKRGFVIVWLQEETTQPKMDRYFSTPST